MPHQSYICWYTSQEVREIILKQISEHNELGRIVTNDYLAVGEELLHIVDAKPLKKMRNRGMIGAIICSNADGRERTFLFLDEVCRCDAFECYKRLLCAPSKWRPVA
jgi:hypothetical protein